MRGAYSQMAYAALGQEPWVDIVEADAQGSDMAAWRGTAQRLATLGRARHTSSAATTRESPPPAMAGAAAAGAAESAGSGSGGSSRGSGVGGGGSGGSGAGGSGGGAVMGGRRRNGLEYQLADCARVDLLGDFATAVAAHPFSPMLVVGLLDSAKIRVFAV